MESISLIVGILGLVLGIYTTWQFSKGVRIAALKNIRMLINRMERDKQKHSEDSPQRMTMDHTQEDLETLFSNLKNIFKVSDKHAPLS